MSKANKRKRNRRMQGRIEEERWIWDVDIFKLTQITPPLRSKKIREPDISMLDPDSPRSELILNDLIAGFEALTRKVDELTTRNAILEKQLREYNQQDAVKQAVKQPDQNSNRAHSDGVTLASEWGKDKCFAPGIEAWKKLKELRGRNIDAEQLERDFTTQGRIGDLRCPFAQKAARRLSIRPQTLPHTLDARSFTKGNCSGDPIAAEFHTDIVGTPPASVQNSAAKCPIRFLDDHSPEEVAKYFENHKHEIPRSHEVCVTRYRSNEESIRQLDAKYGNLVSMIQALGVKHQSMLPAENSTVEQKSAEKIEKWAENCVENPLPPEETDATSDQRNGHFERPLQEVRLGESPSRPWGIQVPVDKELLPDMDGSAVSNAAQSIAAAVKSASVSDLEEPVKKCPFSQFADKRPSEHFQSSTHINPKSKVYDMDGGMEESKSSSNHHSQVRYVFNGPVFFNYPAADIEILLGKLNKHC